MKLAIFMSMVSIISTFNAGGLRAEVKDASQQMTDSSQCEDAGCSKEPSSSVSDDQDAPRNTLVIPLLSLFLPGFGQYVDGDIKGGLSYSAGWLGGYATAVSVLDDIDAYEHSAEYVFMPEAERENYEVYDHKKRQFALGNQVMLAMGSFSAYDAFRVRAREHRRVGEFGFWTKEDDLSDILMAPFRFHFLSSADTYIPLAIVSGMFLAFSTLDQGDDIAYNKLDGTDLFYASGYSFLAGTHEEALFRGIILPSLVSSTGSPFLSNIATSVIFAAAHLGSVQLPVPQLLLGWHLGNVTMKHGYSLQESIFIHTWWDVIAFVGLYQYKKRNPESLVQPTLWAPPFEVRF